MHVLVVGAGVIGTVYGAHLGAAGHRISVLAHGERTAAIAVRGLHARDRRVRHRDAVTCRGRDLRNSAGRRRRTGRSAARSPSMAPLRRSPA